LVGGGSRIGKGNNIVPRNKNSENYGFKNPLFLRATNPKSKFDKGFGHPKAASKMAKRQANAFKKQQTVNAG